VLQEEVTKHRKSVAFSEDTTIMDANGEVTESSHVEKETAESHSAGMCYFGGE
jgi:translation initiation factor 2 subunit 2